MASTAVKSNSTSAKFARAFSLRDRQRPRSKLFDAFSDTNTTPQTPLDHYGLFTLDESAKKISKDENQKIQDMKLQLSRLGYNNVLDTRAAYALRAPSVDGDTTKALDLLMLFNDTISGVIRPFNPNEQMRGAENREKVTCYLDALLFAMFAKTTVFEAMIYHTFEDEERKKLVTMLRLWVNMLRSGRLITTDVTRKLQEALSEAGWAEGGRLRQQDASEAFGFITDKLELPLLTLKTDLFHQGKFDKDDHKFITERLLDVAVPEEAPTDAPLPLEKCLEEYFNNKVEVRRELQRRNTVTEPKGASEKDGEKGGPTHIETVEVPSGTETPISTETPNWKAAARPLHMRERAPSIFSERRVEIVDGAESDKVNKAVTDQLRGQRKASVRKEVAMPAWQFLNLIPWYADCSTEAETQVKAHFASKRPVLGICLKRYKMGENGATSRLATQIDIPLEMAPPHFAVDGRNEADESANPHLKLVLQSVVCHRGQHVNSGHYIALTRSSSSDPHGTFADMTAGHERDAAGDIWLRHDDLAVTQRVTTVDINKALKEEYPYLLFYQVLPVDEDSLSDEPPPYQESLSSFSTVGEKLAGLQTQGRASLEATDLPSRRVSIAVSDEARNAANVGTQVIEQRPISFHRQDSGGITDSNSITQRTRPTTPHDDLKQAASPNVKPSKSKSSRSSNEVGKKMGEVFSRLGGGGSREKINIQEVAVADDSGGESTPKDEKNKKDLIPNDPNSKAKAKERKSKQKSKSRRGSTHLSKLPERECAVM